MRDDRKVHINNSVRKLLGAMSKGEKRPFLVEAIHQDVPSCGCTCALVLGAQHIKSQVLDVNKVKQTGTLIVGGAICESCNADASVLSINFTVVGDPSRSFNFVSTTMSPPFCSLTNNAMLIQGIGQLTFTGSATEDVLFNVILQGSTSLSPEPPTMEFRIRSASVSSSTSIFTFPEDPIMLPGTVSIGECDEGL